MNKIICAINTVSNLSKYNSVIFHDGVKVSWKQAAVLYLYDMVRGDILNIKTGIMEYIDKKKRDIEKNEKIKTTPKDYQMILDEYNQKNGAMNNIWRVSSQLVSIETHMELLKASYDCKMWKEYIELLESLIVRIKYRRIEMPYISEIEVQTSSIQYANIPNKYEKIPVDLNINNYKKEIKRLREEGKYVNRPITTKGNEKDAKKQTEKDKDKNKKKMIVEDVTDNPYEKIEGLEHSFVYLLLRKSHNPNKAIIGFRIVMSNDNKIRTLLEDNERAVAIPISTFDDNLYEDDKTMSMDINQRVQFEKNKLSPYIIYKKTSNGLTNEEEKLHALINIYPLVSNSPFTDALINYKKNESELSIVKQNNKDNTMINQLPSSYNFSHNYINICYKNDEIYHIVERECEILKNLYELENSYLEVNDFKNMTAADKFLLVVYDVDKLEILTNSLYACIQGPLGNYFLNERRNLLYDITVLLWKKYLKDFLLKIDDFYNIESELEEEDRIKIHGMIHKNQPKLFLTLFNIHHVLLSIKNKDAILFAYISNRLADYSERTENISIGVDVVNKSIEYLNRYKEEENIFGLNNYENKHTFTSFTCDNNKITNLWNNIDKKYDDHVRQLNFRRRKNYRSSFGLNKLNPDEEYEEDFESFSMETEYEERLSKMYKKALDKFDIDKADTNQKIRMLITENENTINCLYVDLTIKYYRLYLKYSVLEKYNNLNNFGGDNTTVIRQDSSMSNKTINKNTTLPSRTLKKLDILKGPTATQVKKSIDYLKNSLQEAGKLEPDKPLFSKNEKKMILKLSRNNYLHTLFQLEMAYFRNNKQDQKYLLTQAMGYLNKAINDEESRVKYYEDNYFYIKSFEKYNKISSINAASNYPYNILYKDIMIENVSKIPEPVLIHKTQNTASFIFPIVK